MRNSFFIIISSFLPLTLLNLFADGNSSLAQPQRGQPQKGSSLTQELEAYSLPAGPITEDDMPRIKTVIQEVLKKISESTKSSGQAGNRLDLQPIKSGILNFQDWLTRQGCVNTTSTSYDVEAVDKYSDNIFIPYPGQLPFDIVFNMEGDIKKRYRLLIFVSTIDLFDFASLIENKTILGVPVPKDFWSGHKGL